MASKARLSTEERIDIVREAELEAWNEGDLDVLAEAYVEDFLMHDPMGDRDVDGVAEMILSVRGGTTGLELRIQDAFGAGDRVVLRYTLGGTNTGPSLLTDEPTGKSWEASGISIYRLDGDRIAEQWNSFDYLGVMRQLGLLPESTA